MDCTMGKGQFYIYSSSDSLPLTSIHTHLLYLDRFFSKLLLDTETCTAILFVRNSRVLF